MEKFDANDEEPPYLKQEISLVKEEAGCASKIELAQLSKELVFPNNAQEALFKSLADHLPDLVFRMNRNLEFVYINPVFEKYTGKKAEDFIGKNLVGFYPELPISKIFYDIQSEVFKSGKPQTIEFPLKTLLGQYIFESEIVPEFDQSGIVEYLLVMARDITKHRTFESSIIKSKDDWEKTFNSVPDLIAIIDNDSRIIRVNKSMAVAFSTTSDMLLGKKCYELFQCDLHDKELECPHLLMLSTGKKQVRPVHSNELDISFRVSTSPLFDDNGELFASVHIAHDISDLKKAEEEIKSLNESLEQRVAERTYEFEQTRTKLESEILIRKNAEEMLLIAQNELINALSKERNLGEMKSRFIDIISHEYRTPLTVISSSAYLVGKFIEKQDPDKAAKHLNKIQSSVKILTSLIENVVSLDFDNSQNDYLPEVFDLISLLHNTINEVNLIDGSEHGIKILNKDSLLPCRTDQKHLRRILINLISNAAKFSSSGSDIEIYIEKFDNVYSISVKDYGIGIAHTELPLLFDPFYRNINHIGIIPGIGLGLTIAKNSADIIDGEVNITSDRGRGTTATVVFPSYQSSAEQFLY